MNLKMNLKNRLNHAYNQLLFQAILAELNKAYGQKRFISKYMAIASRVRKEYEKLLPHVFEIYQKEGIDMALSEIALIGYSFTSPDLRGRRKILLPAMKVKAEYDRVYSTLKEKIKRKYRNPNVKRKDLVELLAEVLDLNDTLLDKPTEKWVNLSLNRHEIALNAIALKYGVSPKAIKNAITQGRALEMSQ